MIALPHPQEPPREEGATPRDAATVLLMRDAPGQGVEVWMQRRLVTLAFAPGAWVFPGGAVEPEDAQPLPWRGRPLADCSKVLGCTVERARSVMAAAIRETFEECGVLLARSTLTHTYARGREAHRRGLLAGALTMPQLFADEGLLVDADSLVPWDRWLTPIPSPRRFDTWFFAVNARDLNEPMHVAEGEATEAGWHRPEVLVQQWESVPGALLPPTLAVLKALAAHPNVETALASRPEALIRSDG